MSGRIDVVVKDITNYILQEAQKKAEIKLGLRVRPPLLNQFAFICKDNESAKAMVDYLENEYGFGFICYDGTWRLRSEHGEDVTVYTSREFNQMRGYRYHVIFVEGCIYEELYEKACLNAMYIDDAMSWIKPVVFRLPKE